MFIAICGEWLIPIPNIACYYPQLPQKESKKKVSYSSLPPPFVHRRLAKLLVFSSPWDSLNVSSLKRLPHSFSSLFYLLVSLCL